MGEGGGRTASDNMRNHGGGDNWERLACDKWEEMACGDWGGEVGKMTSARLALARMIIVTRAAIAAKMRANSTAMIPPPTIATERGKNESPLMESESKTAVSVE